LGSTKRDRWLVGFQFGDGIAQIARRQRRRERLYPPLAELCIAARLKFMPPQARQDSRRLNDQHIKPRGYRPRRNLDIDQIGRALWKDAPEAYPVPAKLPPLEFEDENIGRSWSRKCLRPR